MNMTPYSNEPRFPVNECKGGYSEELCAINNEVTVPKAAVHFRRGWLFVRHHQVPVCS